MSRLLALLLVAVAACESPGPTTWQVVFTPLLDVSACRPSLQWCCQNVTVADGAFDEIWAPNEPNTLRIAGTLTDDAVTATLECVGGGSATGTMTGERADDHYQGSVSFAGSTPGVMMFPWWPDTIDLEGIVTAAGTGAPVVGATVGTSLDDATTVTNSFGAFYLVTSAPTGDAGLRFTVQVEADGFTPVAQESLWGDHAYDVSITMDPG